VNSYAHTQMHTRVARSTGAGASFPMIAASFVILMCVIYSALLPCTLSASKLTEVLAWIICVLCAAFAVLFTKKFSTLIITVFLISMSSAISGLVIPVAFIMGTVFSIGAYACLVAVGKRSHYVFLAGCPILAYVFSLVLSGDIIFSFTCILWMSPALALGLATRDRKGRTKAIFEFCVWFVLCALLTAATYTYAAHGSFAPSAFVSTAREMRQAFIDFFAGQIALAGKIELSKAIMHELSSLADLYINIISGIFVAAFCILGFLACKIMTAILERYEFNATATPCKSKISVSVTASIIFIAAYVLSSASSSSGSVSMIATVAQNLCIMFVPALTVIGVYAIAAVVKRFGFWGFALCAAIPLISSLIDIPVIYLLALSGAAYTLIVRTDDWAKQHYSKGDGI